MASGKHDSTPERERLLEGWLPLAQDVNGQYGWALEPVALETLILHAAPALQSARTAAEARLSLWSAYQQRQRSEQP